MDNQSLTSNERHVGGVPSAGRSQVDLHCHSVVSDGAYSPSQVVAMAAQAGVLHLALTDHDNLDGVAEAQAAAAQYGIEIIPGIELSADGSGGREVHILGLYLDVTNQTLQTELARLRRGRDGRAQAMVEKLGELGMPLSYERVLEIAGSGSVGRPHIARAMLERGYVQSNNEAFDRFLRDNGPAHVERAKLIPEASVALIHQAGGVASFAHPIYTPAFDQMIDELAAVGLDAVEAYYGKYTSDAHDNILRLTLKKGLIPTGGSDFHGQPTMNDTPIGGVFVPLETITRLQAQAAKYRTTLTS